MMDSLKIEIREFRSQLPHYLLEVGQPLAITRHGETIGYYIPSRDKVGSNEIGALRAAAEKLDALMRDAGVNEDEIVEEFSAKRRNAK